MDAFDALPVSAAAAPRVVAVACSGGRDSVALLHACARAARLLGVRVVALHVHHGLNPRADQWLAQVTAQVGAWAAEGLPVALMHERLAGGPAVGDSIEAWARAGRHEALQRMGRAAGADLLLVAHHRRDQAETFLLQALRGAGMAGLAAMPSRQWRDGVCWARPWLDHPREAVEAYVQAHGLRYIDDDSNEDVRFARNRLRHQVWPALGESSAGVERALAQSAAWAQEALALQQEMAAQDLARWSSDDGLDVTLLAALSPARASNALRAWLRERVGQGAPASLVARLLRELPAATAAQWPCGHHTLSLYRGRLTVAAATRAAAGGPPPEGLHLDLSRPGRYPVPAWGGAVEVFEVTADGVSASRLSKVELRPREGGVQFQAHHHGIPRSLKKCWQSAGIPAPQRDGPLLYLQANLLFVPGLGLDARQLDGAGGDLVALRWRPETPQAC